jgi:cytochrome c oxidase subunit 1
VDQPALAVSEHDQHGGHEDAHSLGIHMPSPSYYPVVAAIGLLVAAYGLLLTLNDHRWYVLCGVGALILCAGIYGWTLEPTAEAEHAG